MRVLVTGAGGFVGGYLISHLLDVGHEVVASSLEPPADVQEGLVSWEVLDLTDAPAVCSCVAAVQPEGIIHCAAQASVGGSWNDPTTTYRSNIEGTGNLLEAAKELRPRMVLIGSAQQYARTAHEERLTETSPQAASSPYALTKIAQEHMGRMYLDRYQVPVVLTRSFNHTGPGQSVQYAVGSFCSQIARLERAGGGEMHVGNLDSRRDFLDVRDVVRAYTLLLEGGVPGEPYNICSGRAVRMGEVLDKLLEVTGLKGRVQVQQLTKAVGSVAGDSSLRSPPGPHSLHASAGADLLVGDPTKVQAKLGWRPEIPLDRSLVETLDWYRSEVERNK